jgi:hypothetical protein
MRIRTRQQAASIREGIRLGRGLPADGVVSYHTSDRLQQRAYDRASATVRKASRRPFLGVQPTDADFTWQQPSPLWIVPEPAPAFRLRVLPLPQVTVGDFTRTPFVLVVDRIPPAIAQGLDMGEYLHASLIELQGSSEADALLISSDGDIELDPVDEEHAGRLAAALEEQFQRVHGKSIAETLAGGGE